MRNPLRSMFDALEPRFERSRALRPLRPLFDATKFFFFSPGELTPGAPFVRDGIDLKRMMMTVVFALMPTTLIAILYFGPYVISMIIVSYVCGGLVEFIFASVRKEEITEGFLVTGLLLPLTLPASVPLWVVGIGSAFGVLVGKEIFGGTGHNPLNPAITGRVFIFLAWPLHTAPAVWPAPLQWPAQLRLSTWLDPDMWMGRVPDSITSATPLALAKAGKWAADAPETGFLSLLHGNTVGAVGATSAVLIALGGVYLVWTKVANWRPLVSCLVGAWLTGALMHLANPSLPAGWFHLLTGGMLFAAVFMVTDPVSGPVTNPARYAYGVLIGVLVVIGRNLGAFADWIAFSVLLMNLVAPLLDEGVWAWRFRRLSRCPMR